MRGCQIGIPLLLALTASAVVAAGELAIGPGGETEIDRMQIRIIHYGKNWSNLRLQNGSTVLPDSGSPIREKERYEMRGRFFPGAGSFRETIETARPNLHRFRAELTVPGGVETELLAFSVRLPAAVFAGKRITIGERTLTLPETVGGETLSGPADVREVRLETPAGTACFRAPEGETLRVRLQDDRFFTAGGNTTYDLRIHFTPEKGNISSARCGFDLELLPAISSFPVRLPASAAPEPFPLAPEPEASAPVVFENVRFAPAPAEEIPVPGGRSCLYLLAAAAEPRAPGATLGVLQIRLANGETIRRELQYGRELADYRAGESLPEGIKLRAAKQKNAPFLAGGYAIQSGPFPAAVVGFRITDADPALLIGAATAADEGRIKPDPECWILPGEQWRELDFQVEVEPGSILDFSDLTDAPAGKYGPVTIRGDHFEFAGKPGVPQRFYGANICFGVNYQAKEELRKTVLQLRKMGYNTIRIHHYDRDLVAGNGADGLRFDPEKLDRLDYLFHQARENGMYVAIDLYTLRPARRGELKTAGGRELRLQEYKMFAAFDDEVFDNWKEFARKLLLHVNPYTGVAWKDDPALFNICLANENNLNAHWNTTPETARLVNDAFRRAGGGDRCRFNRFLIERQREFHRRASAFIRSLDCKVPLTDMNMHHQLPLALVRQDFDYVDDHIYHDHPRYLGKSGEWPNGFHQASSISRKAEVPRLLFPARLFGKPFVVSEYNFCAPNRFRAESGLLTACYASLQNYSVLQRFAYSHWAGGIHRPSAMGRFDIVTDPVSLLADRMGALIFLSGFFAPGKGEVALHVDDGVLNSPDALDWKKGAAPEPFSELGLITRIGITTEDETRHPTLTVAEAAAPDLARRLIDRKILPEGSADSTRTRFRSDTEELELDSDAGNFTAVSPRAEGFLLSAPGTLSGKFAKVSSRTPWNVIFLASRDGRPLPESSRILVMHLTDSSNLKAHYSDSSRRVLLHPGVMPHLIARGVAELTLQVGSPGEITVHAIGMDGKRRSRIPVESGNGTVTFLMDTFRTAGGTLLYEIVRNQQ